MIRMHPELAHHGIENVCLHIGKSGRCSVEHSQVIFHFDFCSEISICFSSIDAMDIRWENIQAAKGNLSVFTKAEKKYINKGSRESLGSEG